MNADQTATLDLRPRCVFCHELTDGMYCRNESCPGVTPPVVQRIPDPWMIDLPAELRRAWIRGVAAGILVRHPEIGMAYVWQLATAAWAAKPEDV